MVRMPWADRGPADLVVGGLVHDQLADGVGDLQQLVHADAAPVAGAGAHVAALALGPAFGQAAHLLLRPRRTSAGVGVVLHPARRADAPQQPLADTPLMRRRHQERLDAHVGEPVHRGRPASTACSEDSTKWPVRAACMAMRAVSSSRISPTRMTSGSWRRMPRRPSAKVMPVSLTLHLVDAVELVLDRVLDGDHVAGRVVDLGEGRVQRGGLARARRAGAQQHAERRPARSPGTGHLDRWAHAQVLAG